MKKKTRYLLMGLIISLSIFVIWLPVAFSAEGQWRTKVKEALKTEGDAEDGEERRFMKFVQLAIYPAALEILPVPFPSWPVSMRLY